MERDDAAWSKAYSVRDAIREAAGLLSRAAIELPAAIGAQHDVLLALAHGEPLAGASRTDAATAVASAKGLLREIDAAFDRMESAIADLARAGMTMGTLQ